LVAFLYFLLLKQTISCMNQALPHGLKRKIDKLSKWESQSPAADRGLSDHAQRLESRAGSLGKQSYMKERWIIMAPQLDWIPAYLRLGAYSPQL
jgi:hypothetical protein